MARVFLFLFIVSFAVAAYGLSGPIPRIPTYAKQPSAAKLTTRSNVNNAQNSSKQTTKSGSGGISAWGIVALIVSIILILVGIYYFIIFYPLICAKERKYDVMDSSSV